MNPPPALRLDGVECRFDGARMRFDLDVAVGEWLAVIGPSGAGKSTLLDLASGFLLPDAGRVAIGGLDMTRTPPADRPLSLVFQENNLFPHLDVFANVALGLSTKRRPSPSEAAAVGEALRAVGLEGFETRRPATMSGGERQRVALARAFLRGRPLLLLDEPFAALGPALRREMLSLLADLRTEARQTPVTVVMVTHHPEDARRHADRVAFLDKGRILAAGPTAAMLDTPDDPALRAYLGL